MTTCSEIRALLLEAEPGELRGEGGGTLASHLRSCEACRRRAGLLLQADEALEAALGAAPAPDVEVILALAAAPVEAGWRVRAVQAVRRAAAVRRTWIPLAAAAALTGLLLVTRSPGPAPAPVEAGAQGLPLVESAGADGVAILETDNPDITVLWFFEQGT